MNIATHGGKIIVKDGKPAEGCGCCGGGWYCYGNPCSQTPNGYNSLWVCGEDEVPPNTINVQVTFSGQKWCEWAFGGGDEKGPSYAFSRTYDPSTSLNTVLTLTRTQVDISAYADYNSAFRFKCAYSDGAWPNFLHYPWVAGVNGLVVLPGNRGDIQQEIGTPWECLLYTAVFVKQYDSATQIPYSQWQSTQPSCSVSTSGTESLGLGSFNSPRGITNFNVHRSDAGPFTATNPTLSGLKWTLNAYEHPICTVEVI